MLCVETPQRQVSSRFAFSIGSCSQLLFLHLLRRHGGTALFKIHGRTTLMKAKFGNTPRKRPKNDLNWKVGSSGRAASGGALAPEPRRQLSNSLQLSISQSLYGIEPKNIFFSFFEFSLHKGTEKPERKRRKNHEQL